MKLALAVRRPKKVIEHVNLGLDQLLKTMDAYALPQGYELIARNWLQAVIKATNK